MEQTGSVTVEVFVLCAGWQSGAGWMRGYDGILQTTGSHLTHLLTNYS